MPRGEHPNSLRALEENRARTQFKVGDNAVERHAKMKATKQRKKTFREQFEIELAAAFELKDKEGNVVETTTVKDAITKQVVQRALKGNTRAFELIRDTVGEKPADTVVVIDPDFSELDGLSFEQ